VFVPLATRPCPLAIFAHSLEAMEWITKSVAKDIASRIQDDEKIEAYLSFTVTQR
jgi:hypothetical protein